MSRGTLKDADRKLNDTDIPSSPTSSADSLFDDSDGAGEQGEVEVVATRTAPPIPGLYVFPGLLPRDLASELFVAGPA